MFGITRRCCLVALILTATQPCSGETPLLSLEARSPFQQPVVDLLRMQSGVTASPEMTDADHPLLPVLRFAYDSYVRMQSEVRDYRCRLIKRERVRSRLQSHEHMQVKLRHEWADNDRLIAPFSVYMKFLGPTKMKGREVLYVAGANNGEVLGTKGGSSPLRKVTMWIDPEGPWGMEGNRYPVTQLGLLNLTRRLIEEGTNYVLADTRGECQVAETTGAKIDDRPCRYIQVRFPVRRSKLKFHVAEIFIDEELNVPVRYAAYGWPEDGDDAPRLLEEYTYLDIDLNVGLTDLDFQRSNPDYHFAAPKRR